MSEIATLNAQPRTGTGSRAAAKLRKQGLVPGIVYGHKEANRRSRSRPRNSTAPSACCTPGCFA